MSVKNYWRQSEKYIYVAAHRGWSEQYPENTMEAYRAAAALGVDQIEIDVRVTKDGELVLIHDATVDRTTNGTGRVCDMTLAELRALDAGSYKDPKFAGCRIPTLKEFMDFVTPLENMTVDFELKEYPTEGWEQTAYDVCDRVLQMIADYNFTDRCVINTFSTKLHEYIREKYGDRFKHHVYFPETHHADAKVCVYDYAYCVCMFGAPYMAAKKDFDAIRAHGARPWAGAAVRDEEGVNEMIRCGAELVTCNNPDVILDILRRKGYHA